MHQPARTAEELAARRRAATAEITARTGIDAAMIETLVRAFYVRIAEDDLLGPIFAERIRDWEPHLQKMFSFWSSVALMSGSYSGRPMQAHALMPVDATHFDRWLKLFGETANEICPPLAAAHFCERAAMIAKSLEMGIATVNSVRLRVGERYHNPALHTPRA